MVRRAPGRDRSGTGLRRGRRPCFQTAGALCFHPVEGSHRQGPDAMAGRPRTGAVGLHGGPADPGVLGSTVHRKDRAFFPLLAAGICSLIAVMPLLRPAVDAPGNATVPPRTSMPAETTVPIRIDTAPGIQHQEGPGTEAQVARVADAPLPPGREVDRRTMVDGRPAPRRSVAAMMRKPAALLVTRYSNPRSAFGSTPPCSDRALPRSCRLGPCRRGTRPGRDASRCRAWAGPATSCSIPVRSP